MNIEAIKEILDDIDIKMLNSLNEQYILEDEKIIEEISSQILQVQQGMLENQNLINPKLQTRIDVTAQAFMLAKDKGHQRLDNIDNANKYYKWIDDVKNNSNKQEITFKEALYSQGICMDSGHDLDEKVEIALNKSYTLGNGSNNNLPKKQTWFDRLKARINNFFNKKASADNQKIKVDEVPKAKYIRNESHKKFVAEHQVDPNQLKR